VGIITALPKEFAAAKAMLDNPVEYSVEGRGAGREYVLGEIPAKGGGMHAVALVRAGMGNNQAAARATLLLEHFDAIDAILMVGIAAGVPHPTKPEHHVRLGDIVVSDMGGVVKYDFDKETLDAGGAVHIEHRHPPRPPGARLLEAVLDLDAKELENDFPWERHIARADELRGAGRPIVVDELRDTADPTTIIPHPEDASRRPGMPRVFKGPIASADKLLKNPVKRDMLRDRFGVKAIEMEGSGIADATWNFEVGYLVVRGICDFGDGQKGDIWQMYAAIIAAAYARAVLERMRARSPSRTETHEGSAKLSPELFGEGGEGERQRRHPWDRIALTALVAMGAVAILAIWGSRYWGPPAPTNPIPSASVSTATPVPPASSVPVSPAPPASSNVQPALTTSRTASNPATVSPADPKKTCRAGSIGMENGPKDKTLCGAPPAKESSRQGDKIWWAAPGKRDIPWMCSCDPLQR
jgi:nucleoside phosphorylase